MKYKFIFALLVLFAIAAPAQISNQKNFTQGYIVLLNGDTLKGNLALLTDEESCSFISFKKNTLDTVTTFTPDKVRVYNRENFFYEARPVTDKKTFFFQLIENGKVKLYKYAYEYTKFGASGEKTIDRSGPVEIQHSNKPIEKTYDYYLEKTNGDFKKISRLNQRGDLWTFFKGNEEMVKKLRIQKLNTMKFLR